jgi:hypothetical protein
MVLSSLTCFITGRNCLIDSNVGKCTFFHTTKYYQFEKMIEEQQSVPTNP